MKRISDYQKLFEITPQTTLAELKIVYRNLIKKWHPDKFRDNDELLAEAEANSKKIIDGYHFLVSISKETHAANAEHYTYVTTSVPIDDYVHKGQTLKITFQDGSAFEYLGVPKNTYIKLVNSGTVARFARRHIFHSFTYRNVSKNAVAL